MLEGIFNCSRHVQLLKVFLSTDMIPSGIVILVMEVPSKAPCSISFIFPWKEIFTIFEQFLKANCPIAVTPWGIAILVPFINLIIKIS